MPLRFSYKFISGNWLRHAPIGGKLNRQRQIEPPKAAYGRGTPAGFPRTSRLPLPLNGWPTARLLTKGAATAAPVASSTACTLIECRNGLEGPKKQV